MSRNGSGTYNLPAGNPVVTGTTISTTWANTTLSDIAGALTGSVASDGQTPMSANLNMATNKIVNLADPANPQDAATKTYTDTAISSLGLGTISTQSASSVAITGGAINATTIGATTPSSVKTSSLVVTGATSGTLTLAATAIAGTNTATFPAATGTVVISGQNSAITASTAVASTSGTSIDFTGIPSWVKRITVMFNGISTNAASTLLVQVGSGSVSTTGYASQSWTGTTNSTIITTGLIFVTTTAAAANTLSGTVVLTLIGSNTWISNSNANFINVNSTGFVGSGTSPALSGALDRVRITTGNGTDTFDAGLINILYE